MATTTTPDQTIQRFEIKEQCNLCGQNHWCEITPTGTRTYCPECEGDTPTEVVVLRAEVDKWATAAGHSAGLLTLVLIAADNNSTGQGVDLNPDLIARIREHLTETGL